MARRLQTTREAWLDAGLAALAAGGPGAVRVETIATELGVTKGGFYGQFTDRLQFLTCLLEEWERRSVDDVLSRVEAQGGEPVERILLAGELTFASELVPVDLAVRSWARTDSTVRKRLRRVDGARMEYLRSQFARITTDPADIDARSTLAFALAIGQHFTAAGLGDRDGERATMQAFALLVAVPEQSLSSTIGRTPPSTLSPSTRRNRKVR